MSGSPDHPQAGLAAGAWLVVESLRDAWLSPDGKGPAHCHRPVGGATGRRGPIDATRRVKPHEQIFDKMSDSDGVPCKGYVNTPDGFPQFGIEAMFSRDNGRTWDLDHNTSCTTGLGT